jgi:hypothetical protein
MATTATQKNGKGMVRHTSGAYLDDAGTPAAATLTLGFIPRYVRWLNATDRIQYEWFDGMAAGTTLKTVAAGTRTLDTADVAISVGTDGTVTIGAAAIIQNKQNYYEAR